MCVGIFTFYNVFLTIFYLYTKHDLNIFRDLYAFDFVVLARRQAFRPTRHENMFHFLIITTISILRLRDNRIRNFAAFAAFDAFDGFECHPEALIRHLEDAAPHHRVGFAAIPFRGHQEDEYREGEEARATVRALSRSDFW